MQNVIKNATSQNCHLHNCQKCRLGGRRKIQIVATLTFPTKAGLSSGLGGVLAEPFLPTRATQGTTFFKVPTHAFPTSLSPCLAPYWVPIGSLLPQLPTSLHALLPAYLYACLPTYLPLCLPAYLPSMPHCLHTHISPNYKNTTTSATTRNYQAHSCQTRFGAQGQGQFLNSKTVDD